MSHEWMFEKPLDIFLSSSGTNCCSKVSTLITLSNLPWFSYSKYYKVVLVELFDSFQFAVGEGCEKVTKKARPVVYRFRVAVWCL